MIDMWDDSICYEPDGDDFMQRHASVTFDELEASGEPVRPLEFPTPCVYEAQLVDLVAADHRTGIEYPLKNVLIRKGGAENAYLIKKKVAKSSFGTIKLAVVLSRRVISEEGDNPLLLSKASWESTGEFVAIKCSSWSKIQSMRGRHLVDPVKELGVLQLIGAGRADSHVIGCHEVLQDEQYLYTIMPYCSGGDLYGKLDLSDELQLYPDEEQARFYFRELLSSLVFLQRKGICHRNICLENLLIDDKGNLMMIDAGLSLRVPYSDPCNVDNITDVSEGSTRRLIKPQGQCGKLIYLAPEVIEQKPFDGHCTDLWAAGVVLFIMLVGMAPFGMAHCSDKRFEKISQGHLKVFLTGLDVNLSTEAIDLLQNMFWRDPRDRLTLAGVMEHPWVLGEQFPPVAVPPAPKQVDEERCVESSSRVEEDDTPALFSMQTADNVSVPAAVPRQKHRRKLSGARDLMEKLRFKIPPRKTASCSPEQTTSVGKKTTWFNTRSCAGKV